MAVELIPWDPTDYLETEEDISGFIAAAFDHEDPMIEGALETAARARARYGLPVSPYDATGLDHAAIRLAAAFRAVGLRLSAVPWVELREDEDAEAVVHARAA